MALAFPALKRMIKVEKLFSGTLKRSFPRINAGGAPTTKPAASQFSRRPLGPRGFRGCVGASELHHAPRTCPAKGTAVGWGGCLP